jgi:hypothetical protein
MDKTEGGTLSFTYTSSICEEGRRTIIGATEEEGHLKKFEVWAGQLLVILGESQY